MSIADFVPTTFDHASLGRFASIAHPMREPGRWRLEATGRRGYPVTRADILVAANGVGRIAIDIADAIARGTCCGTTELRVVPNGMLNLGAGAAYDTGYALLYRGDERDPAWDSRALQPGDHYACMPLRPGEYVVSNALGGAQSRVQVEYPDPRATAKGHRLATRPAQMRVGTRIAPDALTIDPGQLLVFAIDVPAQLTVRLSRPDDGPPELAEWRAVRARAAAAAAFEAIRARARS